MDSLKKSSEIELNGTKSDQYQSMSDSDLIITLSQCTENERQELIMTLYERYKLQVLKAGFHYLNDYEEAKDVLHDVFIKVMENAEKLKNPQVFKSWLFAVTRNLCVDRLRKKSSFKNYEPIGAETVLIDEIKTEDRYLTEIDIDRILCHLSTCIQKLEGSLLMILKMRWQGLKASQISKTIRMERTQLRRTYYKIKRILESDMKSKGININIEQIISIGRLGLIAEV